MKRKLPKPEPAKSRALGITTGWMVEADYTIEQVMGRGKRVAVLKPLLSAEGKTHIYTPASRAELPSAVAKLQRGDEAAIIRFAKIYGMFGFNEILPENSKLNATFGDPLAWIWSHAETLRLCLDLKEMLDCERDDSLRNRLLSLTPSDMKHQKHPSPFLKFSAGAGVVQQFFSPVSKEDDKNVVRHLTGKILATIVSKNISGIFPEMAWLESRQTFAQYFHCTALIEMAYWHVANALRGVRVRRCERPGCGGAFIQTDGRQRFCPGDQDNKLESPCAVLARVQRFRQRIQARSKKGSRFEGVASRSGSADA